MNKLQELQAEIERMKAEGKDTRQKELELTIYADLFQQ